MNMAYAVKTTTVIPNTMAKFTALRGALQFYSSQELIGDELQHMCIDKLTKGSLGSLEGTGSSMTARWP
jgi:hypothetical protein